MNDRKTSFDIPTQVAFFDVDGNHYIGGIAWGDKIICGCCGGVVEISEVYEYAPADVANPIIIYEHWDDLDAEICGGERPEYSGKGNSD